MYVIQRAPNSLGHSSRSGVFKLHITEDNRPASVSELDIRPVLKRLFLGELDTGPFSQYFSKPEYFYSQCWPDQPAHWPSFDGRQLLPLWEHNMRIQVVDLLCQPNQNLWFYADCPDEYQESRSLDEAIFDMIYLHVWEYGGGPQEAAEALGFAEQIELPSVETLAEMLGDHTSCQEESINKYRTSLSRS